MSPAAAAVLAFVASLPSQDEIRQNAASPPEGAKLEQAARAVLDCYHPSGTFVDAQVTQTPWGGSHRLDADRSAIVRISWKGGVLGTPYTLYVAVLGKSPSAARTVLLSDNAKIPASPDCKFDNWVQPTATR